MENIKKLQTLIDQATSDAHNEAPQQLYPDILDLVQSRADMPKIAVTLISKRIGLKNTKVLLWSFNLLQFLSYNAELPLYSQISTKQFLLKISGLLKNKQLDQQVIDRILKTIRCWQQLFRPHQDLLPLFFQFYAGMLRTGFEVPHDYVSRYRPKQLKKYTKKAQNVSTSYNKIQEEKKKPSTHLSKNQIQEFQRIRNQILLTNEIIDASDPAEGVKNNDVLKQMMEDIKGAQKKISQTINENSNEKILELALAINDDLYITFRRYKDLQRNKKPEPFILTELASDYIKQQDIIKKTQSTGPPKKSQEVKTQSPQKKQQPLDILDMDFQQSKPPKKVQSNTQDLLSMMDNTKISQPQKKQVKNDLDLLGGMNQQPPIANKQMLDFNFDIQKPGSNEPNFDVLGGNNNFNFSMNSPSQQPYRTDNDINVYSEKSKGIGFPDLLGSGK